MVGIMGNNFSQFGLIEFMSDDVIKTYFQNVHILNFQLKFFILNFILNFLFTIAPSTKGGCFSGGRGKNLITMLLKKKNAKLD